MPTSNTANGGTIPLADYIIARFKQAGVKQVGESYLSDVDARSSECQVTTSSSCLITLSAIPRLSGLGMRTSLVR